MTDEIPETPVDDESAGAPSRHKRAPLLLGWCSAGQHRLCPTKTQNLTCECTACGDDHGVDYVVPVREPSRFEAIYDKYRNGGQ